MDCADGRAVYVALQVSDLEFDVIAALVQDDLEQIWCAGCRAIKCLRKGSEKRGTGV
jgi:hypothetical protein